MTATSTGHVTIVMIEDDEGHARLIEKNLRRAGIMNKLIHFDDGRKAMDYFFPNDKPMKPAELPMLILLDLNLPQVDGYEILEKLKKTPETLAIPIIVLTTTANPKEIDRCYELGCNVYVSKPVDYEGFSESIRKLGLLFAVVQVPTIEC